MIYNDALQNITRKRKSIIHGETPVLPWRSGHTYPNVS